MLRARLSSTELSPGVATPAAGERVGPFNVGEMVDGTFAIDGVIGVGGMGVVYEAHDLRLGRIVAIKAPKFGMHKRALRREAQALAALRSPAFVTIHHLGTARGVDFIVMERLYGATLEEHLDDLRLARRCLPLADVFAVAVSVASGLCAAHEAGFALRDVKPSNVVLTGERIVMIDLGLAVPDVVGEEGVVAGTPQYMAPEVILNDVKPGQGAQIDLYGLGVLLYEAATGCKPFVRDSVNELLSDIVCTAPPSLGALREDAPRELVDLVAELLAKKPCDRPPSAEAVVWRLRAMQRPRGRRGKPLDTSR